jgi:selenide, water dikinase
LLVSAETLDDAAVVAVSDDLAICFTADFITPVVDDAETWGRIAAANALSDVYAMGGKPLAALNLVCWPKQLTPELLSDVLAGGMAVTSEAGCLLVGGHTVEDKEPKYGLAVIGMVHPDRILRNRGARPGDLLYLSKPLGTGIISTAVKAKLAKDEEIAAAVQSMIRLNRNASEAALAALARAVTDVTGFGLAGHLSEMLGPEGQLGAEISFGSLPLLPGTMEQMQMGMIPAGAYRNRDAYSDRVQFAQGVDDGLEILLFDPQTSGGLLIAMDPAQADKFERESENRDTKVTRIGVFNDSGRIAMTP